MSHDHFLNDDKCTALKRIACNVVAPLLTSFVTWVLSDARERGIERLCFVSRNGQIFFKIAKILRSDGDPECRYIYGSRQAWYLPSVIEVNYESLDWAWPVGMSRSGDDILRRLEINTKEVRLELSRRGFDSKRLKQKLDNESFCLFRSLVLKKPLSLAVLDRARYQRMLTQNYLRQEGLFDAKSWALVDVGWTLKSQHTLSQVLVNAGYKEKVIGYYLGVGNNHVPIHECGPCYPFVTPPGSDLKSLFTSTWFFKLSTIILIEHLFAIADHPTACGYQEVDGHIEPVFKRDERHADVLAFGRNMHEAVLRYIREFKVSPPAEFGNAEFRVRALAAMGDFCMHPRTDDVNFVAWLPTNKDQSHENCHVSQLASPLSITDIWAMLSYEMFPHHEAFFAQHFAWIAGSVAISKTHIRFIYRALNRLNQIRRHVSTFIPSVK
jgi:hypothetical protein